MRKTILNTLAAILTGLLLVSVSCTPGSCFEETNAYVKTSMYLNSTGKLLAPDSLTLYGINREAEKIYNKRPGVSHALLPLNPSTESCGFIIRINGITDTITFTYSSYVHLISKECGYTFYHTIDDPVFTKNNIDKVIMIKNTITTISEENIRIYY